MKKIDFLQMWAQDNETRPAHKKLYSEVIDCAEIALSQTSDETEIDASKTLEGAYILIEQEGRSSPDHCCGPFRAAELIAGYLGVGYIRASKKYAPAAPGVKLEDFF